MKKQIKILLKGIKMIFDGPENEEKDINKTMEYLILNGALQVSGIDSETGEFM